MVFVIHRNEVLKSFDDEDSAMKFITLMDSDVKESFWFNEHKIISVKEKVE